MTQVAVYTAQDGSTHLMYAMPNVFVPVSENPPISFVNLDQNIPAVTVDQIINNVTIKASHRLATIAEIAAKDCPQGSTWAIADDSTMPDNYFRDAWVHQGNGIVTIDMTKAVNIHKKYLRQQREPLMPLLDVAYTKALETADTASQLTVVARKNNLRNITSSPEIAAATTPAQLKTAALSILQGT